MSEYAPFAKSDDDVGFQRAMRELLRKSERVDTLSSTSE